MELPLKTPPLGTLYVDKKRCDLNSIRIKRFIDFWQIFHADYNDHRHSIDLLLNAMNPLKDSTDVFLYLIYCLESLISFGGKDSLTFKISQRTTKLLGNNLKNQIEVSDEIKKLYKIRSNYVHEGKNEIDVGGGKSKN